MYVDRNKNGMPDAGDQFVRHAKIILDGKVTEESDTQGAFYFRDISEGTHTVVVDINSLPLDMIPLIKLKNEIRVSDNTTYVFHVPLSIKQEK